MDVFCRCTGCGSCNGDAAVQGGGKCGNTPQKYHINTPDKIPPVRHGYRKYCKPCLRKMELARLATKHSLQLGLVPGHLNRGYTDTPGNRPRIMLFGDSITEQSFGEGGFGGALQNEYKRDADVILRGYSGYNTAHAANLLKYVFPLDDPSPPVLVTVCFGANDAVHENSSMAPVQGCDLQSYAANLKSIALHLQRLSPPPAVLFITPPPVDSTAWHTFCKTKGYHNDPIPDRDLARTGAYAAALRNVAGEIRVPCVDLFNALMGTPGWEREYLSDGLHLTPAGYRAAYTHIAATIKENFPALTVHPEDGPSDFPDFKTIRASCIGDDLRTFVAKRAKIVENHAAGPEQGSLAGASGAIPLPQGSVLAVSALPPSNS